MAKISKLSTISSDNKWYVVYDDSDSQTDYFNSTRGSQKYITKCIKEEGNNQILVDYQNGIEKPDPKHIKAVERLAKNSNYKVEHKSKEMTGYNGDKWTKYYAVLTKKFNGDTK